MRYLGTLAMLAVMLVFASQALAQDAAEATMPGSAPAIFQPTAISQRVTAADVLGAGRGYVHPFLSVAQFHTDNLFNTPEDEESEWTTVLSPGIWVSVPSQVQPSAGEETVNTAPGGMQLSRLPIAPERRFQGYALYRADLRENREFPKRETDTHRGEGLLYYRLRGGLAFEMLDIFVIDQDAFGTGANIRTVDRFASNLWQLSVTYPVTPKLGLEASYGLYGLDYDSGRNSYRDRDDQTASASVFFRALPKTSLLLSYEFIDIDYDRDILTDRDEHRARGGVQWDMTAKSRARFLLGYGRKEFDGDDTRQDFIGEARIDYAPTEKTKIFLGAVRRSNETNLRTARDMLTHRVQVGYAQRLAPRWGGAIDAYYINNDYRGELARGGQEREDDFYGASLTFGYAFRRWLNFNFGYSHVKRDSNLESFDYDTNTVFAAVSASL